MKSVSEKKSGGHRSNFQDRKIQAKLKQWPSALSLFISVLGARARCMTWHVDLRVQPCAVRMRRNNWRERP